MEVILIDPDKAPAIPVRSTASVLSERRRVNDHFAPSLKEVDATG